MADQAPWWVKPAQQFPALAFALIVLYGLYTLLEPLFANLAKCVGVP